MNRGYKCITDISLMIKHTINVRMIRVYECITAISILPRQKFPMSNVSVQLWYKLLQWLLHCIKCAIIQGAQCAVLQLCSCNYSKGVSWAVRATIPVFYMQYAMCNVQCIAQMCNVHCTVVQCAGLQLRSCAIIQGGCESNQAANWEITFVPSQIWSFGSDWSHGRDDENLDFSFDFLIKIKLGERTVFCAIS